MKTTIVKLFKLFEERLKTTLEILKSVNIRGGQLFETSELHSKF